MFEQNYNNRFFGGSDKEPLDIIPLMVVSHRSLSPQFYLIQTCSAMLVTNLADPEWMSIDCQEPLTGDIFCLLKVNITCNESLAMSDDKFCLNVSDNVFLKNETCFVFVWLKNIGKSEAICEDYSSKTFQLSDIKLFEFLFNCVSAKFPPIFHPNFSEAATFQRILIIFVYSTDVPGSQYKGYYVCADGRIKPHKGDNMFLCSNGVFISSNLVCNGNNDCGLDTSFDEAGCWCNTTSILTSQCKFVPKMHCSPFYLTT